MAFPNNPNPGDTYTDEYGTVWVYAGPINGWYRQTVIPVNDTTYIGSDGAPGGIGNNTEVVFNDNGSLASDSGLTYNKTTDALSGGAFVPTGSTVPSNGVYLPSANNVAISTNGTGRLFISDTGNINIDGGTFFLNATTNRVGIGTPSAVVDARLTIGQTNDSAGVNTLRIYRGEFTSAYAEFSGIGGGAIIDSVNGGGGVIVFKGDGTERARIDSSGRVGIGTTSPTAELDIERTTGTVTVQLQSRDSSECAIDFGDNADGDIGRIVYNHGNNYLGFTTNASERARIDSSGRLLVGTSTSRSYRVQYGTTSISNETFQLQGESGGFAGASFITNRNADPGGSYLILGKSRGSNPGGVTAVQSGDNLGSISFSGADGSDFDIAAAIRCDVDGTPGTDDMPGRLVFSTTADGAATPTERMRITSNGNFLVGDVSPIGTNGHLFKSSDYTATYRTSTDAGAYVHAFASDITTTRSIKYAIYANGTAGSVSDVNLKKNIEPARNYLDDLMKIEVVKYQWATDEDSQPKELGYIAQQVANVFPGMVSQHEFTDENGDTRTQQMLKKEVFVPMLLKAVQELKTALDDANSRIAALETS